MSRRATLLDSRLTTLMNRNDNAAEAVQIDQVVPKTLLQKFWHASVPIIGVGDDTKKANQQTETEEEPGFHRKGPRSVKSRGAKSHLSKGTRKSRQSKGQKSSKSKVSLSKTSQNKLSEPEKRTSSNLK